jgi:hypothetical protein
MAFLWKVFHSRKGVFIITSLDSKTHNFKIIGLLAILCLVLCSASVRAADNSSILVSNPYILIDPIGNHTVGDVFFINGTTNLPVTENLTIHIYDFNFYCCVMLSRMKTSSCPSISSNNFAQIFNISISSDGSGTNQWSVDVTDTAKKFLNGKYIVSICSGLVCNPEDPITDECKARGSVGSNITNDFFTLFPVTNTSPTTVPETILSTTTSIQPIPSQTIVLPMTQSSPLPFEWPIVVLATITILRQIYRKKRD